MLLSVAVFLLAAGVALGVARAAVLVSPYDGSYQGTLNYTANVPDYGSVSGSAPITLTVAGGGLSGSFGPVPQYGTISFSGSVTSTGSGSASAAYSCAASMQFSASGSVSGSVSGCTDQGGTASGSFSATRVSAPPSTTTPTAPTPTTKPTSSAPESGVVRKESGQVTVTHPDGSTEPVAKTITIHPGDRIKTGRDGKLVLYLGNGSLFSMSPNSEFEFTGASKQALTYKQLLGKIRYALKCALERCRVTTSTACACVRGTEFSVETRPGWTRLRVYKHTVDFYNVAGKQTHVLVRAGFESVVRGSKPPTIPKRFK